MSDRETIRYIQFFFIILFAVYCVSLHYDVSESNQGDSSSPLTLNLSCSCTSAGEVLCNEN